ncbi:MAG: hypothetical protein BWK79_00235 [Beggiatoa sp. IS2]|nr:MAG: hypothetical protein BWK79_00235 [Beggiatoa sp. IS2]
MAVIMRNPLIFGIIFIVSLAINLFLGGVAIGWYMQKVHDRGPPFSQEWNNPPAILDALPEARERIYPVLRRNGSIVHPKIQQLQQAKREVHRQIRVNELDVAALTQAFAQLRQTELEAKAAIHQVFIEVISTLTKEERQRLEQRLPHQVGPPGRGRFRDGPPPLPPDFFEEHDIDKDGKLSYEEFLVGAPESRQLHAEQHFKKMDANGDSFIAPDELEAMPPPPPPREFEDF